MKTYNELMQLQTDEERLNALGEVGYTDFDIVEQWAQESNNPEMKKIFHSRAVRLYHEEEFRNCGEI